ncbi:MAG: ribosome biogenesis GTPase YlqF [Oscillospiraceae bacterium]|jgi:ribosome biogenesis GTPase A|nr:ribosome biogenesis GTPase YlqF [Oscillospiraceae bacterium]
MSADNKQIQWFPGHMAKTRRLIRENLKLCDAAIEIVDARVTRSGRNPEIEKLLAGTPRILLLNKCDLADAEATARRVLSLRRAGTPTLAVDCRSGRGLSALDALVRSVCAQTIARNDAKGMTGRALRLMVVGIPNCGKSSFINRMAGRVKAEAADRPGVTRRTNWFRTESGLELLDTPGVLWPKFDDPTVGLRLAFIGSIKDEILDLEELACAFLRVLRMQYPDRLAERYKVDAAQITAASDALCPPGVTTENNPAADFALLEAIAQARGFLQRGGAVDTLRAAKTLLDEYRGGLLGRISLD